MTSRANEKWPSLLGADPLPWLLEDIDPAARWLAQTELLGRPETEPEASSIRREVVSAPGTLTLVERLPVWERDPVVSGHNSPSFAPNLLGVLADRGIRAGDFPRIEHLLNRMLDYQDDEGRFMSLGRGTGGTERLWSSLLCDNHAIVETLIRFDRGEDPRTQRAIARMRADLMATPQGIGWPCRMDPATRFRGPGRKEDVCPQVTLEALRAFARLPTCPDEWIDAARTCLGVWRNRGQEKPYMFGHGRQFKTVKWPTFWYDIHMVLDTLSRFPALWRGAHVLEEDRVALAELTACMIAYNFGPDGSVIPHSCYKGFEAFDFGQKKRRSGFATAKLCAILRRLDDLVEEARAVDVLRLLSSKGGTGIPVPPRPFQVGSKPSR